MECSWVLFLGTLGTSDPMWYSRLACSALDGVLAWWVWVWVCVTDGVGTPSVCVCVCVCVYEVGEVEFCSIGKFGAVIVCVCM